MNIGFQYDSRVLLLPNRSFGPLLDILPKNFIFLKNFNLEFSHIKVGSTDKNSKTLDIKD